MMVLYVCIRILGEIRNIEEDGKKTSFERTHETQSYDEYLKEGRIINDLPWNHYGGEFIVFKHPKMDAKDMFEANTSVLHEGFTMGRILRRTLHTFLNRPSPGVGMSSFFTQLGMRKSFRAQFKQA